MRRMEGVHGPSSTAAYSRIPRPCVFSSIYCARACGSRTSACSRLVLGTLMDGVTDTVDHQVGEILPDAAYVRLQTDLPKVEQDLDDSRRQNVEALKAAAQAMMQAQEPALKRVCEWF